MKLFSFGTLIVSVLILSACANMSAVNSGQSRFENGFAIDVNGTWNQFERGVTDDVKTWTRDGLYIDALRFFTGIEDGTELAKFNLQEEGQAKLIYKSDFGERAIVALFDQYYSRDGSVFTTTSIAPALFVGEQGIRFDFELIRKADGVRLTGSGWFAKKETKLYALVFTAPKLGFYEQRISDVVSMSDSATVTTVRN